ncbi:MAG: hypothetical protein A3B10_02585 [Candidatus Doudnabacteria bacterium RIFCSPLOWO2_01_FULL_44_21]|uniref:Uncharacterized protein n=1 Tax=Candidatus Doudnabacteria bacterium RIFCSPLOWO2_01_FULL_44_21 TaxID=1817841 RepID=A0A1F5PXD1_9BACT|nr:MAG: hypothetical protein A3B95_00865 [Candidatus Doudnabacteria bacterium RIFCSPHIGHO2_02_FULL_43_13b]OGE94514.1 MAG: hypothetical protein A3B10_02585 [Candidatus Doudnabacteria bacterium RIFCSPLOWO2_01_FULL_44_21]
MLSADFLTRIFTKDQSWLLLVRISTGHDINIFLHSIRAFCISFLYVHFRVRNALLLQRLQFAFRPFSLLLTEKDLPTATRMDLHHLAYITAARLLILYKTRERIHRDEADSRLLAIPAS